MEVQFTEDLQSKLTRMAEQQGRDSAALIIEAVERLVHHEAWFTSEVEQGLAAADRSELTDHQAVTSGAMKMPEEEMDWKRFFSHPQTATISNEAAVQAVIDSRGDR